MKAEPNKLKVVGLIVLLYVCSVTAMLVWPILYFFRGKEVVRSATQALNAALGGLARESFSSRMGRTGDYPRIAALVDSALPEHTVESALSEAHIVERLTRG